MARSIVIAAIAATICAAAPAAQAASRHHARIVEPAVQNQYCLQGRSYGYPGDCAFSSYEQCQATASGTDAGCGINPMAYARQRQNYY